MGNALPAERKQAIAERLHQFTGLPVDYLLKGNLRIDGGTFEQQLQTDKGLATGRLDSRFSGPTRSEEHTSELQSLMRISYAVFCLKKKKITPSVRQTLISST